jgi:hypothetical protein
LQDGEAIHNAVFSLGIIIMLVPHHHGPWIAEWVINQSGVVQIKFRGLHEYQQPSSIPVSMLLILILILIILCILTARTGPYVHFQHRRHRTCSAREPSNKAVKPWHIVFLSL